jgi:phosphohistidine swiveling domain-containing protein
MDFDEARFKAFIDKPGLLPRLHSPIILYQGTTDTVAFGKDVVSIRNGIIKEATLLRDNLKISIQELEAVMTISEKLKAAGFPNLEINFSEDSVTAKLVKKIPTLDPSDELVGIPASAGKISAPCLVFPTGESPAGRIIVLKNSRDLHLLMKHKPAGIVLEEGSLLSHASILAREARIPAIVKVENATKKLKTGDVVILDGSSGVISIPTPR